MTLFGCSDGPYVGPTHASHPLGRIVSMELNIPLKRNVNKRSNGHYHALRRKIVHLQMRCQHQNVTLYLAQLKTLRPRKALKLLTVE